MPLCRILISLSLLSNMWVGNVNIRFKKLLRKKVAENSVFCIYRVPNCNTRNLLFLLFKSTCLGTIFKKGMRVGV